jgi:DNA-binding NtrC family response regulator
MLDYTFLPKPEMDEHTQTGAILTQEAHESTRLQRPVLLAYLSGRVLRHVMYEDELVVGRGDRASFVLPDSSVSRAHARLRFVDGSLTVEDLGSRNGTAVTATPLSAGEPRALGDGTLLRFGAVFVEVRLPSPSPAEDGELARVARSPLPVLVLGETGTGKERLTERIHELSGRTGPLVRVHCAALPETLIEGELFGHERGAFTGAHGTRVGLIESAEHGTLFLDELGEIPLTVQVKLLRVLDTRRVARLGGGKEREVDVRFIAATHRDLARDVAAGRFREDLYYRLAGYVARLAPLRERSAEIPVLARSFAQSTAEALGLPAVELSEAFLQRLLQHDWPGNVRELRQVTERAVVLGRERPGPEHIVWTSPPRRRSSAPPPVPSDVALGVPERPMHRALAGPQPTLPLPRKGLVTDDAARARIEEALAGSRSQTEAAKKLGVSPRTLYAWVRRLGIRTGADQD